MLSHKAHRRTKVYLPELLAGVILLGVASALLVPRVAASCADARAHVQAHQIAQLKAAVDRYYIENNGWPMDLAELVPQYVPDGIPTPPRGGVYHLSASTNRVACAP